MVFDHRLAECEDLLRRFNRLATDVKHVRDFAEQHKKTCDDLLHAREHWKAEATSKVNLPPLQYIDTFLVAAAAAALTELFRMYS